MSVTSALPNLEALRTLQLADCKLSDGAAAGAAQALSLCPSLTLLDLSSNPLGSRASAALAEQLPAAPQLHTLLLAQCGLQDAAAAQVLSALRQCQSWTHVSLSRAHRAPVSMSAAWHAALACW